MAEDNKTMANEELGSLFSSNMMSIAPNVITSLSADTSPIPSIENVTDATQSVINNNVNLSLNIANAGQGVSKNYNNIGKEINNFLNTEKITDPLDLKKNYQSNLKIENTNLISNNSYSPSENISINSSSVSAPVTNITNSNITNFNSNLSQTPPSMSSFENNVINGNESSTTIITNPKIENISNQQIPQLSSDNVNIQSNSSENITNNSNITNLTNQSDSSIIQSTNNNSYQSIGDGNSSVSNFTNSYNYTNNQNQNNMTNVASMSTNSQQQFVGNYSTVVVENRASYKPLERMDANPNPQFSNGQRDIINTSPSEKVQSIETRLMELERIEGENRDLNNEKTNSIQNYSTMDAVFDTPMFEKISDNTSPHKTSNINKSSMSANTIGILINKMNSPPIWRTVLG